MAPIRKDDINQTREMTLVKNSGQKHIKVSTSTTITITIYIMYYYIYDTISDLKASNVVNNKCFQFH